MIKEIENEIIDPVKEAFAYEVLWSLEGMTEKQMSTLFQKYDALPSKVLANKAGLALDHDLKDHQEKVKDYLASKLEGTSISVYRDFQYPESLRKVDYPTELFYYKGNLDLLSSRSISIVGARKVSSDGIKRAIKLTQGLIEEGFTIVSGLAQGVDTVAHETSIKCKGKTIGVIGTPIDEYYPKENRSLQDQIGKDFLLISQVPFYRYKMEPFMAHKSNFPRRNKTMAAISEATVIVEASDTSGSLTQARSCLKQGKKLFILDSCFKHKNLSWPHNYEKKGAIRVRELSDILDNL